MLGNPDLARAGATVSVPLISAITEIFIKPKLQAIFKNREKDKELLQNALESSLNEYLRRSYITHSYVSTIAFQNQPKLLSELYIPLELFANILPSSLPAMGHVPMEKKERLALQTQLDATNRALARLQPGVIINGYPTDLISDFRKLLIVDSAGMGKSTILKYLFTSCIDQTAAVPVLIPLRHIGKDETLLAHIIAQIKPLNAALNEDFLLELIERGDFVFLLDGYDEIPSAIKTDVTRNIQDFIERAANNEFVISSRPDRSLASFGQFRELRIRKLTPAGACALISKYDSHGALAVELNAKIRAGKMKHLDSFLGNPLLVALLYRAYQYKPTLPRAKHIFYRQVYDALYESHDLSKGGAFVREKKSGLDIEQFHAVLRAFGLETAKLNQVEYGRDELVSLLQRALDYSGMKCRASDMCSDLLMAVPLLLDEGDTFRWCHRSFQDYFAAQAICLDAKGNQRNVLSSIYKGRRCLKYANVLDLCYDIDYKGFSHSILGDFVSECVAHHEASYPTKSFTDIAEDDLRLRRALTFGRRFLFAGGWARDVSADDIAKLKGPHYLEDEDAGQLLAVSSGKLFVLSEGPSELVSVLADKEKRLIRSADQARAAHEDALKTAENCVPVLGLTARVVDDDRASPVNNRGVFRFINAQLLDVLDHYVDYEEARTLQERLKRERREEVEGGRWTLDL